MKKKIELIMAVCLVIAAFFLGSQSAILVQNSHIDTKGTPDTDSSQNTGRGVIPKVFEVTCE